MTQTAAVDSSETFLIPLFFLSVDLITCLDCWSAAPQDCHYIDFLPEQQKCIFSGSQFRYMRTGWITPSCLSFSSGCGSSAFILIISHISFTFKIPVSSLVSVFIIFCDVVIVTVWSMQQDVSSNPEMWSQWKCCRLVRLMMIKRAWDCLHEIYETQLNLNSIMLFQPRSHLKTYFKIIARKTIE